MKPPYLFIFLLGISISYFVTALRLLPYFMMKRTRFSPFLFSARMMIIYLNNSGYRRRPGITGELTPVESDWGEERSQHMQLEV